jgi:hypothetical protein
MNNQQSTEPINALSNESEPSHETDQLTDWLKSNSKAALRAKRKAKRGSVKPKRRPAYLAAKRREYWARLVKEGKLAEAAAYRERETWAWTLLDLNSQGVGGEGVQGQGGDGTVTNSPELTKFNHKDISPTELSRGIGRSIKVESTDMAQMMKGLTSIGMLPVQFVNELREFIDKRVLAHSEAKEQSLPVTPAETPIIWQEEARSVVWEGDPEDCLEAYVTAAPKNDRIRIIKITGVEEYHQVWVQPGLWPMVGWTICIRPTPEGYVMIGEYGRKGDRIR